MSVFEYEAPFTPVRPRKKRKNRVPEERPDQAVVLARTIEELSSGGWISQCTRKPPSNHLSLWPILPTLLSVRTPARGNANPCGPVAPDTLSRTG